MPAIDIDWAAMATGFQRSTSERIVTSLARNLGVTAASLEALGVGWSERDQAWTFPEQDGAGNIIGILRRFRDGHKRLLRHGQRGLYVPHGWRERTGVVYLPEGASDVAALLSRGLRAVGRPSCTGGVKHLCDLLANTEDQIIVMAENDRRGDGQWPGRDGARRVAAALAHRLGHRVRWALPPEGYKDIREFLTEDSAYA